MNYGAWGAEFTPQYQASAKQTTMRQSKDDYEHDVSLRLANRVRQQYREFKEANAHMDADTVEAAKILYAMNTGGEFQGSDEEVTRYAIEEMGRFNHSLFQADLAPSGSVDEERGMVAYAQLMQSDEVSDLQKLAFVHLVESYDAMDADNWSELSRWGRAVVDDPTTYTGIGALAGMAIKWGGKKLGQQAIVQGIKRGVKLSAMAALEGALYEGAFSYQRQEALEGATDTDYTQQRVHDHMVDLEAAAIGGTVGAVLPHAPAAAKKLWEGLGFLTDNMYRHGTFGSGIGPLDGGPAYKNAEEVYAHVRDDFLTYFDEESTIDDVMTYIDDLPKDYQRLVRAMDKNDWLGYDNPADALHAAFTEDLQNYETTLPLRNAIGRFTNQRTGTLTDIQKAERYAALRAERNAERNIIEKPDVSYRGHHTAPEREGANTLDDMSDIFPDDIYNPSVSPQHYGTRGHNNKMDQDAANIIAQYKGKPDSEITVYRSVPKGVTEINKGDWVTLTPDYASYHGDSWVDGGEYDIIQKKVKARDVVTDGNSMHEFGYIGEDK